MAMPYVSNIDTWIRKEESNGVFRADVTARIVAIELKDVEALNYQDWSKYVNAGLKQRD